MESRSNSKKYFQLTYSCIPTVAGTVAKLIVEHPPDTVEKLSQKENSSYGSILRNLKQKIDQQNGLQQKLRVCYPKGLPVAGAYKFGQIASTFILMDPCKKYVKQHIDHPVSDAIAGGVIGATQTGVLQLLSLNKIRVQLEYSGYSRSEFLYQMQNGLGATVARNVTYFVTAASVTTQLEKYLLESTPSNGKEKPKLTEKQKQNIVIGGILAGTTVSKPLDIAKTRLQTCAKGQVKPKITSILVDIFVKERLKPLKRSLPLALFTQFLGANAYCMTKDAVEKCVNPSKQRRP